VRSTQNRILQTTLASLCGLGLVVGGAACAKQDKPGVATAATNGAAQTGSAGAGSAGATSWTAYDAAMTAYAACLSDHGLPGVRYAGHKASALELYQEMSGLPAGTTDRYVPEFGAAVQACKDKLPQRDLRPEPYAKPTMDPSDLADARAMAKCIREQGVSDYPDPDPDPEKNGSQKYMDAKPGMYPKVEAAGKVCEQKLGITDKHPNG
jgi:hypothetical protein